MTTKKKILGGNEMKKLNLELTKTEDIGGDWSFQNDFHLIAYYIDDSYFYIYSRVTKKTTLLQSLFTWIFYLFNRYN